jgi:hypothetical protein
MNNKTFSTPQFAAVLLVTVLLFASSALAGPPLVCHSFAIGDAKSLPWIGHSWNLTGSESYDTKNLASDTIAILDSNPVVIVHMETLRRATLYARKDSVAAKELFVKLVARANAAGNTTASGALASFDEGYLAETYKAWIGKDEHNPAQGVDGYALVTQAILVRGNDPEMEFAAALISLNGSAKARREHANLALDGAKHDPLLARNLSAQFNGPQTETMAEVIFPASNNKMGKQ